MNSESAHIQIEQPLNVTQKFKVSKTKINQILS